MRLMSLLLLAATGAASAQSPDDFAWQWPITATGDDGAHALVLDDAVYARITRADCNSTRPATPPPARARTC